MSTSGASAATTTAPTTSGASDSQGGSTASGGSLSDSASDGTTAATGGPSGTGTSGSSEGITTGDVTVGGTTQGGTTGGGDACPNDQDATEPAACCTGRACAVLCPGECAGQGGTWLGAGVSCSDAPPPCAGPACVASGPFSGLLMQPGATSLKTSFGLPTTSAVDLHDVDSATAVAKPRGLTLTPERQRPWNFTGARDAAGGRYYAIGGRPDVPPVGADIVTVNTVDATLVSDLPLAPQVDLVHLAFDHAAHKLYGLVVETEGFSVGSSHVSFPGALSLVQIDPATGKVTTVAAGLPGGFDHFAATVDAKNGRYYYHTATGALQAVNLGDGGVTTTNVPEILADLQFDDAGAALYGLRLSGDTSLSFNNLGLWSISGTIDLVRVDTGTGTLTVVNKAPLPGGISNWASAFDCESGRYLYVSASGDRQVVDVATGGLVATAPGLPTQRYNSLD